MKNTVKSFIGGMLVMSIISSVAVGAADVWKTISVLPNTMKVVVDGEEVQADNFLYNDTTYLPIRAVSEAIGQNVQYDVETSTATIKTEKKDDKVDSTTQMTSKNILSEKKDDNRDIFITGEFSTGVEGEARTVINANGIQSYNAENQKHGLWCSPQYSDFDVYYEDRKILSLINGNPNDNGGNYSLYLGGNHVILADEYGTKFGEGISGTFTTADGKKVKVEGGVITQIK